MESNSNEKITTLIDETIELLVKNDQERWANFLRDAKNNFIQTEDKNEAVVPIIKSMLGGSGSLSDVVLHREGKPLIEENNQLYNLLNELYDECKKFSKII